jgi:transposase
VDPRGRRRESASGGDLPGPFHIVKWATDALDKLRRRLAGELRSAGRDGQASTIKGTRWALIKNPDDLTPDQRGTLSRIASDNGQLYRGYLMKEQLRQILAADTVNGRALLAGLISWASHSKIPEFTALARTLKGFRQLIWNTLDHRLSNGRAEGINTQLAALTVRARGFHSAAAFIAMANLTTGGLCPDLPGRAA